MKTRVVVLTVVKGKLFLQKLRIWCNPILSPYDPQDE